MLPMTTQDLYPVKHSAETMEIIDKLLTSQRIDGGRAVLRMALSSSERQRLQSRMTEIRQHISTADRREVARCVSEMLAGFGSSSGAGEQEAKAVVSQYVKALVGLPLWCIARACGRFARGEVTADEVRDSKMNRAFAPSTAQLRMVAERMVRPVFDEINKLSLTLNGTVSAKEIGAEERARVKEKMAHLAESTRSATNAANNRDSSNGLKLLAEASRTIAMDEYARAGVELHVGKDGSIISLPTLLAIGWQIKESNGTRILTQPHTINGSDCDGPNSQR